jgi:hypothetical protein
MGGDTVALVLIVILIACPIAWLSRREIKALSLSVRAAKMDRDRKRLLVLLAVAIWLCVSAWLALYQPFLPYSHGVSDLDEFAVRMFTYSLPALLFGGILFWAMREKR